MKPDTKYFAILEIKHPLQRNSVGCRPLHLLFNR